MRNVSIRLLAIVALCSASAVAASKTIELDSATIADLNRMFDAGTLSSEKLVELCLARIQAYDHRGPGLNAVITLNPRAVETARALDIERKAKGPR
jgi:amidase